MEQDKEPILKMKFNGYNPESGEWNDSLRGNFLWSGANLVER